MNSKAFAPQVFIALLVIAAGFSLIFMSNNAGLLAITGFGPATPTSCGDVSSDLTLTSDISFSSGFCFNMTASDIVLNCDGNSITGTDAAGSAAIYTNLTSNLTVKNCMIKDAEAGVFFENSTGNFVFNNTFESNTYAAFHSNTNYTVYQKNNFTQNEYAYSTATNTYFNGYNSFSENTFYHESTQELHIGFSNNMNVTNNKFDSIAQISQSYPAGNSYAFINNTVETAAGIFFGEGNPSHARFIGNTITVTGGSPSLFYQYDAVNWTIENNVVTGLTTGNFYYGRGVGTSLIKNNSIYGMATGIELWLSPDCNTTIIDNTFRNQATQAITTTGNVGNGYIINNSIFNVSLGIFLNTNEFGPSRNISIINNIMQDVDTTIYATTSAQNPVQNTPFKITIKKGSTTFAIVDFGNVNLNFSNNISLQQNGFRITNRHVAVDTLQYPSLNKSANISYLVVSCDPIPDIKYSDEFRREPTSFNELSQNCNATIADPNCTNMVCANNMLNFTVEHFSTYMSLPPCITPLAGRDIWDSATLCNGSYGLSGGMNFSASNLEISCNATNITGTAGYGFEITGVNNITINNCYIDGFVSNVHAASAANLTLFNNTFLRASTTGVSLTSVSYSHILNNSFMEQSRSALEFIAPSNNNISGNLFNHTYNSGFYAVYSQGGGSLNYFENNRFFDNLVSYFTISNTAVDGWVFRNNQVENNSAGSDFISCGNCLLENNRFVNSGTLVSGYSNNTVRNNFFSGGNILLQTHTTSNATIFNNTLQNASIAILVAGLNNTILNNTIFNASTGIRFDAGESIVTGNSLTSVDLDFNSTTGIPTYFVNQTFRRSTAAGEISFGESSFNFTNTTYNNMVLITGLVSLNSSHIPELNHTANISFAVDSCSDVLYFSPGFFSTVSEAQATSSLFADYSGLNCSGSVMNFTTNHFSTIFADSASTTGETSPPSGAGANPTYTPVTTPAVIPVIPENIPPIEEKPILPLTSIAPSDVNVNNFACAKIGDEYVLSGTAIQSLGQSPFYSKIKEGYSLLVPAFKVSCENSKFTITLALPDTYSNITALRCRGDACSPVSVEEVTRLNCGNVLFEDVSRKSQFMEPEFFPIALQPAELKPGQTALESGRTKITFTGDVKGGVSLDKLFGPTAEAVNSRIKIVGTPTVLSFEDANPQVALNITLPYAVPDHVDELSVAVYAYKDNKWTYLGGDVDTKSKTVSASITNASQYMENKKITLALMGLLCLNCHDATFRKVYDGGSRDAVILVHGFENSPERFDDIINDIRLTNQPWQVWTFGYSSNNPIDESAGDLADLIQANSKDFDFVYIAAHSLGGLIAQQALRDAYDANANKAERPYPFIDKVVKIISVATPNEGALSADLPALFNSLLNSNVATGLFNLNSRVVQGLMAGREIPRVPGIEYLAVAGTQPYGFTDLFNIAETNDGLVTLSSAQDIGGEPVNNYCSNFWALNATHTAILDDFDSRKIIERVVAKEIADSVSDKAIIGHSQYYDLDIASCSPDDQYIIIGTPLSPEAVPDPGLCSCGNGVCGIDEDEISCSADCAVIRAPAKFDWLAFKPFRYLLLALTVVLLGIILLSRKHRPTIALPPKELTSEVEKKLNNLVVQIRTQARLGNYDRAVVLYSKFVTEYSSLPYSLHEKFRSVAEKVKKEVEKKVNR